MHFKFQLLILLGLFISSPLFSSSMFDSLRIEQKDGRRMIVHQVDAGETLFALSRRYKVDVSIIKNENALSSNSLNLGQIIFLPVTDQITTSNNSSQHTVAAGETLYSIARKYQLSVSDLRNFNNLSTATLEIGQVLNLGSANKKEVVEKIESEKEDQLEPTTTTNNNKEEIHRVVSGETLYSISRKYDVSIQDLKVLNNLAGNSVDIGQELIIKKATRVEPELEKKPVVNTDDNAYVSPVVEVLPTIEQEKPVKETKTEEIPVKVQRYGNSDRRVSNENGFEQIIEEGFAMKIENTPDTQKYLALHRTLPIGKIIQIKNQMNNQTIFVRVIGKLPDVGANTNVVVRLSEQAFSRLGAIDPKIPIEIIYLP